MVRIMVSQFETKLKKIVWVLERLRVICSDLKTLGNLWSDVGLDGQITDLDESITSESCTRSAIMAMHNGRLSGGGVEVDSVNGKGGHGE